MTDRKNEDTDVALDRDSLQRLLYAALDSALEPVRQEQPDDHRADAIGQDVGFLIPIVPSASSWDAASAASRRRDVRGAPATEPPVLAPSSPAAQAHSLTAAMDRENPLGSPLVGQLEELIRADAERVESEAKGRTPTG